MIKQRKRYLYFLPGWKQVFTFVPFRTYYYLLPLNIKTVSSFCPWLQPRSINRCHNSDKYDLLMLQAEQPIIKTISMMISCDGHSRIASMFWLKLMIQSIWSKIFASNVFGNYYKLLPKLRLPQVMRKICSCF